MTIDRRQLPYGVFSLSLLICIILLPSEPGRKVLFAGLGIAIITGLPAFDRLYAKKASPGQWRRVTLSTYVSSSMILLPFALKAPPESLSNFLLDVSAYTLGVVTLSLFVGSRLDILFNGSEKRLWSLAIYAAPAAVIMYIVIVGIQSHLRYAAFTSEWVDFSFEFPPVWQTFRYGFFRMINEASEQTSLLRYHWPLIYTFLAPVSLLWDNPVSVLWIQVLFFAATAACAGLLAFHHLRDKALAAWFTVICTLYLPMHLANLYDFHADPLAMPFLLLSFYFAEKKRWGLYAGVLALALLCKEYVALAAAGWGILLLFRKEWRPGMLTVCAGLFWFFFVNSFAVPMMNGGNQPDVIVFSFLCTNTK